MIIKIVVKTEPIDINGLFLSCLIPNLNNNDVENNIIRMTKTYLPISINGILSESTS